MTNLLSRIEPFAYRLEATAAAMEADGIEAVALRRMAAQMRSETGHVAVSGVLMACESAGVPVPSGRRWDSLEALNASLDVAYKHSMHPSALQDRMELKNRIFAAGLVTEEKPRVDEVRVKNTIRLLNKYGIKFSTTHMFSVADIDQEMNAKKLAPEDRASLKQHLLASGMLDPTDGNKAPLTATTPAISAGAMKMARAVLQRIGLDEPIRGARLNLGIVNSAMAKIGLQANETIPMKGALAAAGFLD